MAYLQNRLSVSQVAWEFGGSVRVFKVPEIIVNSREEKYEWFTASGLYDFDFKGVWLDFIVSTEYFKEQVSGTACDRIDILNALKASGGAYFYPDYLGQSTIKYLVKSGNNTSQLLKTTKALFKPSQVVLMKCLNRIGDYPDWLRYK